MKEFIYWLVGIIGVCLIASGLEWVSNLPHWMESLLEFAGGAFVTLFVLNMTRKS